MHPSCGGLYARISSRDQQTLPLQLKAMRQYARRRGWKVIKAVEDWVLAPATDRSAKNLIKATRSFLAYFISPFVKRPLLSLEYFRRFDRQRPRRIGFEQALQ